MNICFKDVNRRKYVNSINSQGITMSIKPFNQYNYYPALRSRTAELKGLFHLDKESKHKILPLITLGKWPNNDDFSHSAMKSSEAMDGNAFFVDLADSIQHHSQSSIKLLDPSNNYGNWQNFNSTLKNAIPVIQLKGGRQRDIVQQAMSFEANQRKIAIRLRNLNIDTKSAIAALSALDDINNAMVFIDAQFIRPDHNAHIFDISNCIEEIRHNSPDVTLSVLSTSFPAARTAFMDTTKAHGSIDNLDRALHRSLSEYHEIIYGDHSSIHAVVYDDKGVMRGTPTIDYPLDLEWAFERRSSEISNATAYSVAAEALVQSFPEIRRSTKWGDRMIVEAASGAEGVFGAAAQSWIAVRVNLHLSRQIAFSEYLLNDEDEGEDSLY
jgi:hypothetical protein